MSLLVGPFALINTSPTVGRYMRIAATSLGVSPPILRAFLFLLLLLFFTPVSQRCILEVCHMVLVCSGRGGRRVELHTQHHSGPVFNLVIPLPIFVLVEYDSCRNTAWSRSIMALFLQVGS
ncbi:hypothetical protein F4825DRAFT_424893 [Nemania diffusa]|nr:hypothetical protein F4825DRAFT_424893 [Nemania diffusa]